MTGIRGQPALAQAIHGFAGRRVLVLGDMVTDEYLLGRPARISREAPVLVLEYVSSFVRPGGATNTACNVQSLGGNAAVAGVVGDDEAGRRLRAILEADGIDVRGLLTDPHRATSTKTRILARGAQEIQQQVVRLDRVDDSSIGEQLRDRLIDAARSLLEDAEALLISDYEHGVLSPDVIHAVLPEARARGAVITVDAHGDLLRFKGITVATPNQPEAEATTGRTVRHEHDLDIVGAGLLAGMDAAGVLITRGNEGLALYERERPPYRLPTPHASDIVDPTGAGDTVAAVFTLALVAGASMRSAAFLGNVAGGEAVRKLGAATLTRADLQRGIAQTALEPPDA